jgi:hypothetical protein
MLNTPLTEMRKQAPGSITGAKIAAFMAKNGLPRSVDTISDFERGKYREPSDRFIELYSLAIGRPVAEVRAALQRTQRMRQRKQGPFRQEA